MALTWTAALFPGDHPGVAAALPFGAFATFFGPDAEACIAATPAVAAPPTVCPRCQAWQLGEPASGGACPVCTPAPAPGYGYEVREGPPLGAPPPPPAHLVVVLDETLCCTGHKAVCGALASALAGVAPATAVSLVTFGRAAHVHHLDGLRRPVRATTLWFVRGGGPGLVRRRWRGSRRARAHGWGRAAGASRRRASATRTRWPPLTPTTWRPCTPASSCPPPPPSPRSGGWHQPAHNIRAGVGLGVGAWLGA